MENDEECWRLVAFLIYSSRILVSYLPGGLDNPHVQGRQDHSLPSQHLYCHIWSPWPCDSVWLRHQSWLSAPLVCPHCVIVITFILYQVSCAKLNSDVPSLLWLTHQVQPSSPLWFLLVLPLQVLLCFSSPHWTVKCLNQRVHYIMFPRLLWWS